MMIQGVEALHRQKAAGDGAFRDGRYEEALACYSAVLEEDAEHVPALCNRSLAALKLGRHEVALQDAETALQLLLEPAPHPPPPGLLAKAIHRKAEALLAQGQVLQAVKTYRQGLSTCRGSQELQAALRLAAEDLPVSWLAQYWAGLIEAAQAPNPFSSRDGRLIKPVPPELRLAPPDLQAHLQAALYPLQDEARDLLCEAWGECRRPGKAEAAFMRGGAYLHAGNPQQALKDARVALVYGPQLESCMQLAVVSGGGATGGTSSSGSGSGGSGAGNAPAAEPPVAATAAGRHSAWPAALALLSGALESLADNVPAALAMARAAELDPECEDYGDALDRLMRRVPEQYAAALQAGGSAALEATLAAEKEAGKPEFLRQRPKYYYYYEWMKKRINAQYPALPEAVMDKLLALEANELDMVLQYPRATQITVERLLDVYQQQGPEQLETYAVPLLSWSEYQAMKEDPAAAAALPAGTSAAAAAEGRLLPAGGGGGSSAGAGGPGSDGVVGMQSQGTNAQHSLRGADQSAEDRCRHQQQQAPAAAVPVAECTQAAGGAAAAGAAAAGGDDAASEAGSVDVDELFDLD